MAQHLAASVTESGMYVSENAPANVLTSVHPLSDRRGPWLDLGCGARKAADHMVGIDSLAGDAVDHVVDLNDGRLPFDDDSVELVFSSNTFEHLASPAGMINEIPRVLFDRGRFELWVPYVFHNHAHVFGHTLFWNEESILGVARKHRDFWIGVQGAAWNLTRLVYVIDTIGMRDAQENGFTPQFAIRHLNNIVAEIGFIGHVEKPGVPGSPAPDLEVVYAPSRDPETYLPLGMPHWC